MGTVGVLLVIALVLVVAMSIYEMKQDEKFNNPPSGRRKKDSEYMRKDK